MATSTSLPRKPSTTTATATLDPASLSPEDARLLRLYGRAPSQSQHFARHLKDRKYFDSGDYALSKAGHGDSVDVGAVGSLHPAPGSIPHPSPLGRNSVAGIGSAGGGGAGIGGGRRKSSLSALPMFGPGFGAEQGREGSAEAVE